MPSSSAEHPPSSLVVDFGGTKILAARISQGKILERRQVETDKKASPEGHLTKIIDLIEALRVQTCSDIGVAVCGRIDNGGSWSALNDNTLEGFLSFPLRDRLVEHFDQPVTVMNDATAAAWGEYCHGCAGTGVDSLLYVTVSTGVGGGIVLSGKPVTSADGLATHFGFMTSTFGSDACGSGRVGTLESVASGTAIGRFATAGHGKPMTGLQAYEACLVGDSIAITAVDRSAKAVAKAVADVRALLGIQEVVIGGSVGLAQGYVALLEKHLSEEPPLFRPAPRPAKLGKDSALFGVASAPGRSASCSR